MAYIGHPRAAVRFAQQGDVSSSDRIPAILWLSLGLLALWTVRNRQLPDGRQALTGAVAVGAIVLAGTVAPRVVVWLLLALLVAAAVGAAPQLGAIAAQLQSQGVSISRGGM